MSLLRRCHLDKLAQLSVLYINGTDNTTRDSATRIPRGSPAGR